jgi:hypothetical protein
MRATALLSSLVAASALVVEALPAAADSRDIDSLGTPFRQCVASAPDLGLRAQPGTSLNDGAFPHICGVNMPQQGPLQASTGEWIMFRVGDQELTLADCQAFEANVTVSFALDGQPVDVNHLPCQLTPDGTGWRTDYRFLSHPLSPGVYLVTATLTDSGSSLRFTRTITVIPQG